MKGTICAHSCCRHPDEASKSSGSTFCLDSHRLVGVEPFHMETRSYSEGSTPAVSSAPRGRRADCSLRDFRGIAHKDACQR